MLFSGVKTDDHSRFNSQGGISRNHGRATHHKRRVKFAPGAEHPAAVRNNGHIADEEQSVAYVNGIGIGGVADADQAALRRVVGNGPLVSAVVFGGRGDFRPGGAGVCAEFDAYGSQIGVPANGLGGADLPRILIVRTGNAQVIAAEFERAHIDAVVHDARLSVQIRGTNLRTAGVGGAGVDAERIGTQRIIVGGSIRELRVAAEQVSA